MKNLVVTVSAVLALAVAMATVAFGAQTSETATTLSFVSDAIQRGALQAAVSGTVAGVGSLPSTSTGGGDGIALLVLASGLVLGGFALIRKAVTES